MNKPININIPPPPMKTPTSNAMCPECGMVHPPTPRGSCPIALERKMKESGKSDNFNKIINLFKNIDVDDKLVDMIDKTIKAWKIKKRK